MLVLFTGPTGAGKSTVIEHLAISRGVCIIPVLTSRKRREQIPELTRIPVARKVIETKRESSDWAIFEYAANLYAINVETARNAADSRIIVACDYPGDYEVEWISPVGLALVFILPPSVSELTRRLRDVNRAERIADATSNYTEILARKTNINRLRGASVTPIPEIYIINEDAHLAASEVHRHLSVIAEGI